MCLESIAHQTYPAVEIVVVDNHSSDATLDIARAITPLVYTCGPERSAQRNAGARTANGSYLLFIDSDMVLEPSVVEQCVKVAASDAMVKGLIIPEESVGEGFWARCKALERSCYVGDDTIEAARFFHRSAFEMVGGYDERLTAAEDWDLSQRVRQAGSLRRIDAYIMHLEGRLTLWKTMQSKFYYGKTLGCYIRKQPGSAARQLQLVRPAFMRHWRRLLVHPILTAGMVVMKGCEFAAGGAGLSFAAWQSRRIRHPA
jgi:glycosyltransferase involved in cell wall biosynthesis